MPPKHTISLSYQQKRDENNFAMDHPVNVNLAGISFRFFFTFFADEELYENVMMMMRKVNYVSLSSIFFDFLHNHT